MSNEIKITEVTPDYRQKAITFLQSSNLQLSKKDAEQFLELCGVYSLNPFTREIYPISYQGKLNIIVGYEVYIKRAERSGLLEGWKSYTKGSLQKGDLIGCVEIHRKGFTEPFYHEVYFTEYRQNTLIWQQKPITMIKKVAIAQGFRLAFPCELGGMPYTSDELSGEPIAVELKEIPKETKNVFNDMVSHKKDVKRDKIKKT